MLSDQEIDQIKENFARAASRAIRTLKVQLEVELHRVLLEQQEDAARPDA